MSLQVSVLLMLLVGVPLLLAAAALTLNAYLAVRRPVADPTDLALEALATESMDELLIELQRSVQDIKSQLTRQRSTLAGLMSDDASHAETGRLVDSRSSPPLPPTAPTTHPEPQPSPAVAPIADLKVVVEQLVAEGLSDRAIARRLRVGLEEVRLTRMRPGRAS